MTAANTAYLPRIADKTLADALKASGAVSIEGAKWCGKTYTASQQAASSLYLQDPDNTAAYKLAADTQPSLLLQGDTPRLLDEWQTAPVLWDAVRFAVDQRQKQGQFILTDSAVMTTEDIQHTGTGRISRMLMRTMSLYESGESTGEVSLKSLFAENASISAVSSLTVADIAFALVRGGWPTAVTLSDADAALQQATNYVDAVVRSDINRIDGVEKNPERVRVLMRSLARNTSTMAKISTLQADMAAHDSTLSETTVSSYINALRRIFVIEDLPAWSPALRSKTAIRTSAKRHFVDPSVATAILGMSPDRLLNDFMTFGFLFESLCIRDLRIYAEAIGGKVSHYRDKSGLEADAIVHLRDGSWGAVEIKMGASEIDGAAENLLDLRNKIDKDKMQEPSFLMVLTAQKLAYQRTDGVFVVPIGSLGP